MTSATYKSTRGGDSNMTFEQVVIQGLASDKGLYLPEAFPKFSQSEIQKVLMAGLSFGELAHLVMRPFIGLDDIPDADLKDIIKRSFASFEEPDVVTPVTRLAHCWVLELFHGPTFAFKDVALQFLGNIFEYFLKRGRIQQSITILGATSGDTGSAAIQGLRGKENIDCYIMFPENKVTRVQELQMTTVLDANIHCMGVLGDFDDCQALVKEAFADETFRKETKLGAINSINWARVLAQTTYYFYSWLRVNEAIAAKTGETVPIVVNYAVPTGNFGDILAGYCAKRMGLPIGKLVVCTNKNDVLHRFLQTGVYQKMNAECSVAPSMDISVSSNFERYLYYLADESPSLLRRWMEDFEDTGRLELPLALLQRAREDFCSHTCSDEDIVQTMTSVVTTSQYLVCPHTATALAAIKELGLPSLTTVALATAHPMKFEGVVQDALSLVRDKELLENLHLSARPFALEKVFHIPIRKMILPNTLSVVQSYMRSVIAADKEKKKKSATSNGVEVAEMDSNNTSSIFSSTTLVCAVTVTCIVAFATFRYMKR